MQKLAETKPVGSAAVVDGGGGERGSVFSIKGGQLINQ